MSDEPFLIHEDRHLFIVHKPSGLATTAPDRGPCLTSWAEIRAGKKLHPTSRLDADVTGMVTFARTKLAARRLREARSVGRYSRGYLALVVGGPEEATGEWTRSIGIDPRDRRLRVALDPGARGQRVQHAKTTYRLRESVEVASALYLAPHTGRTHQLRVHASDAGLPMLGDVRYGGPRRVVQPDGRVLTAGRTMLHCAYLRLPEMESEGERTFVAEAPEDLAGLWRQLGGSAAALDPLPAQGAAGGTDSRS